MRVLAFRKRLNNITLERRIYIYDDLSNLCHHYEIQDIPDPGGSLLQIPSEKAMLHHAAE